ncbi:chromosome segregation in meiosis- protein [Podila epigama]|nr:chromosome segregation in meiosis- protein [Podila epigama]
MDDINPNDEPFEQFDTYDDDYEDMMMQEAERHDQIQNAQHAGSSTTAEAAALPAQRDFLAMLREDKARGEQILQQDIQQQRQQQRRQAGAEAPGVDIGAVQVAKKRVKVVTLDQERLLSDQGLPILFKYGKRLKIRHRYTTTLEKNANTKENLGNLMRLYQTWGHNLFPKSTFRDFIIRAESKCRSDRQLKATMEGWREAHWEETRKKAAAKEDALREQEETRAKQEAVWREAGVTRDLEEDPLSLDDGNDNGGEGSSRQTVAGSSNSGETSSRIHTAPSKKNPGKSSGMRLTVSDDEDDAANADYEITLSRMRESMNLGQSSSKKGQPNHPSLAKEAAPRKNEIDLDDYSDSEDDEDGEEPLFSHRALQLMGGLDAVQKNRDAQSIATLHSTETSGGESTTAEPMDEDRQHTSGETAPSKLPLATEESMLPVSLASEGSSSRGNGDLAEEDEGLARRKPSKARRAILLDSDEDD